MNLAAPAPKVSVLMITFNHASYIRQAVESAVQQQTDFPIEVVVGDDFSTDGTREILRELQAQYPDRVRPLLHGKNLGMFGKLNLSATLKECQGEYFAVLEGDDYWESPHKLKRQVELLDAHPEYAACFHDVWVLAANGERRASRGCFVPEGAVIGVRELLTLGCPHTCSVMFRRAWLSEYPPWFFECLMGDWPALMHSALRGPVAHLPGEPMSVYRLHITSGWSSTGLAKRTDGEVQVLDVFGKLLPAEYQPLVAGERAKREFFYALAYEEGGDLTRARAHLRRYLRGHFRHGGIPSRRVAWLALKLWAPWLLRLKDRLRGRSTASRAA